MRYNSPLTIIKSLFQAVSYKQTLDVLTEEYQPETSEDFTNSGNLRPAERAGRTGIRMIYSENSGRSPPCNRISRPGNRITHLIGMILSSRPNLRPPPANGRFSVIFHYSDKFGSQDLRG